MTGLSLPYLQWSKIFVATLFDHYYAVPAVLFESLSFKPVIETWFQTSSSYLCHINNQSLCSATVKNRFYPVLMITRASWNFLSELAWLHNHFPQIWSRRKTHAMPPARMENKDADSDRFLQHLIQHCGIGMTLLYLQMPFPYLHKCLRREQWARSDKLFNWCSFELAVQLKVDFYDGEFSGTGGIGWNSFWIWRKEDEGLVRPSARAWGVVKTFSTNMRGCLNFARICLSEEYSC